MMKTISLRLFYHVQHPLGKDEFEMLKYSSETPGKPAAIMGQGPVALLQGQAQCSRPPGG